MRVVVAGNGILGLTTAFRLAKRLSPGDEIVLVGKPARPGSATLAAGAMLNSFAELEAGSLDSPVELLRFELSHLSSRMWPRFLQEIIASAGSRLPPGCSRCEGSCGGCFAQGTYVVDQAADDDGGDANFDAVLAALARFDEPHQLLSPGDVPHYLPGPRCGARRAVYLPREGWLNPRLIVQALEGALASFPSVRFLDGAVHSFQRRGAAIESALLEDGQRLEGDKFLLATGATASEILSRGELGLSIQRVFYGVGCSLEIESPDSPQTQCIRTAQGGRAGGVYAVPYFVGPDRPHDHILLGASSFISPQPVSAPRRGSVAALARAAAERINAAFHRAKIVRVNLGWRPTSQDTFFLVGLTSIPNLAVATGTRRDGFHLSPLLSDQIADQLLGAPVDERLAIFAPERKLLRSLTREQAIARAVRHPPAESSRGELERLHDRIGARDWGIPVEMLEMYRSGHARAEG